MKFVYKIEELNDTDHLLSYIRDLLLLYEVDKVWIDEGVVYFKNSALNFQSNLNPFSSLSEGKIQLIGTKVVFVYRMHHFYKILFLSFFILGFFWGFGFFISASIFFAYLLNGCVSYFKQKRFIKSKMKDFFNTIS